MTAVALLKSVPKPTDAQIEQSMGGNICRCGAYVRIRQAIKQAARQRAQADDDAIRGTEVGRSPPGPIEDEQLVLDDDGFRHHGTGAAGTREPRDCR